MYVQVKLKDHSLNPSACSLEKMCPQYVFIYFLNFVFEKVKFPSLHMISEENVIFFSLFIVSVWTWIDYD